MAAVSYFFRKIDVNKIVFLDRDGVINKCAAPHEYIINWDKFKFLENVPRAIMVLNNAGYKVVIISNQRCIALGIATSEQIEELHGRLNEELQKHNAHIDAFYYCPHNIGECDCRKPEIGLFHKVEQLFEVDKLNSYMIGDSESDVLAGQRYGVTTIFIGNKKIGDFQCSSLYEATKIILKKDVIA